MNCKQGELAVIVKASPHQRREIGHICRILQPVTRPSDNAPGWHFEPPTALGNDCCVDEFMRPIRDPGDGAQDESLQWVPSPGWIPA